jgi:hypothetical protein
MLAIEASVLPTVGLCWSLEEGGYDVRNSSLISHD